MNARVLTGGLVAALGVALVLSTGQPASAASAPVALGTAGAFGVLAGTAVTNTGPTVIGADLGLSPGSAVTGFPPGLVLGATHISDANAQQAQADLTTAYNDAAGRSMSAAITADLGGQTLTPGVYSGTTLALTGTLTLDAQGDPNAVFVFQDASTLITASGSNVALINGASACSVFWQIGSSATFGTSTQFAGTVLALTSVTANTGVSVGGRLLARNGAVTLDTTTVTVPQCAVAATPSPSASVTTSSSATPSSSVSPSGSVSPRASASASSRPSVTGSATPRPTRSTSASPAASVAPSQSAPPATGGGQLGGPTPTPVEGPVVPAPAAGPPTGPVVANGLPHTGAPVADTLEIGLVLIVVGGVLCLTTARRR